jgi:excisionase family DNA binding protein
MVLFLMALSSNGRSEKFWTIKEAAAHVRVHPETFRRWLKGNKKKIPVKKFGRGCYRIPKDKFIEWAEA